jgi:hypothetical protein
VHFGGTADIVFSLLFATQETSFASFLARQLVYFDGGRQNICPGLLKQNADGPI